MITYKKGDVFTSDLEYIGHGVNCKGVMGSGIAVTVRENFPKNYEWYRETCKRGALKPGMVLPFTENGKTIMNIASQFETGADARMDWLEEGIIKSILFAMNNGRPGLAIPRIGAGIGGLVWEEVDAMLQVVMDGLDNFNLEIWEYEAPVEK